MMIQKMSTPDCLAILGRSRFGRLGCALDNQPYVVPILYAYERSTEGESFLYAFTTLGQKIEWMRANPRVCFEWDEVHSSDHWTSIIVTGRYEELPDDCQPATRSPSRATLADTSACETDRRRAQELLREHLDWWKTGYAAFVARQESADAPEFKPIYYRIRIDEITGYRSVPDGGRAA